MIKVDVGDVLVVSTGTGWTSKLIKVGEVLRGQDGLDNHVAVMHHVTNGVPWALEGRPGGVGWVDARRYLANPRTVTNAEQPKTPDQRHMIAVKAEAMIGTPYDWEEIAADAFRSLGIPALFAENWRGKGVPGQVVCSSYAAWLYDYAILPRPEGKTPARQIFPGSWTTFCLDRGWTPKGKTA